MINKLFLFVVLLFLLITGAGCSDGSQAGGPTPTPVLDGAVLLQTRCTECHSLRRVERETLTLEEWQNVVSDMVVEGAHLQPVEADILNQYLAENFPAN